MGVEPIRLRLRTELLQPLCIHVRMGGYSARPGELLGALRNSSFRRLVENVGLAPTRLSACKANPGSLPIPQTGTPARTRTSIPQLKRLVSSPLSYRGKTGGAPRNLTLR